MALSGVMGGVMWVALKMSPKGPLNGPVERDAIGKTVVGEQIVANEGRR